MALQAVPCRVIVLQSMYVAHVCIAQNCAWGVTHGTNYQHLIIAMIKLRTYHAFATAICTVFCCIAVSKLVMILESF